MAIATQVSQVLHVFAGGLVAGAVAFVAAGVLPVAGGSYAVDRVLGRLAWLSRIGGLVVLLTGGHLAGVLYTVDSLLGTARGWAVLAMLVLWIAMTGLVEAGTARFGRDAGGVRLLRVAGLAAVLLFVDAGLLASGAV